MPKFTAIRVLMVLAGLYDGLLGLAFLTAGPSVFALMGVTPPNHWGYVQFAAALLIVFATMFFAVAADPIANRRLLPYGIMLKISYCSLVFYHWAAGGIPDLWKPFAFFDLGFIVLFAWVYAALAPKAAPVSVGDRP